LIPHLDRSCGYAEYKLWMIKKLSSRKNKLNSKYVHFKNVTDNKEKDYTKLL